MGLFVRKVRTGSGATAVQIASKTRGVRTIVEHVGSAHDDATLAALVEVAKGKIAAGQFAFDLDALTPVRVTAAPTVTGSRSRVLWEVLEAAYHDLFQVEASFRMAKTDLRARPMFHHEKDSIDAHLTVVFIALAISRHLQQATGISIRKLVRTLKPLRYVTISIAGRELVATTPPGPDAADILATINAHAGH